jgi:hypothetical protein
MEFGIALYDALIGANVPPDKAKAVVIELECVFQPIVDGISG